MALGMNQIFLLAPRKQDIKPDYHQRGCLPCGTHPNARVGSDSHGRWTLK